MIHAKILEEGSISLLYENGHLDNTFVTSTPFLKNADHRVKRSDINKVSPQNVTKSISNFEVDGFSLLELDNVELLENSFSSEEMCRSNALSDDKNFPPNAKRCVVNSDNLEKVKVLKPDTAQSNEMISNFPSSPSRTVLANICINSHNSKQKSSVIQDQKKSLSSQIKQRLRQNSLNATSPILTTSLIRAECIQKALDEAKVIQEQLSPSDIGPFYGLPSKVKFLLKSFRGIDELYHWQDECLKLPVVKQKKNLIYTLPTSGGKTLVAEILIMREILCYQKDAILVLPYVSLVQEKVRGLAPFAVELDFVIEECAGSKGTFPPRKKRRRHTLYICTFEKAHMLVNSLIETKRLQEIGILVADEIHMIGETGGRGATLESLLTKVLYVSKGTQIIGMSATLSNMEDLKQFLHAEVYEKNFRPVELREFVKVGHQMFEFIPKVQELPVFVRNLNFDYSSEMLQKDPDMITGLVREVIPQNSCLIFCPTKKHCESVANMLSQMLPKDLEAHKAEEKLALYNAVMSEGDGYVCSILASTIKFGVAYHHSGLTLEERKLIEEAYISGTLCCLTCTSTLAAGVNLPAKRVILRAPYIARDFMSFSRYKQMIGRAGRAGIDSSGESILMIKPGEEGKVKNLLCSDVDACNSCLLLEPNRVQMLLLSLIGLDIAKSLQEIQDFMAHTLASVQCREVGETPEALFENTVKLLVELGLIKRSIDDEDIFCATKLGRAAFKGGVEASQVNDLCQMLRNGSKALALNSYLHLLFIVTPVEFLQQIKFNNDICFRRYVALSAEDQSAANHIGINESMIMLVASGRSLKSYQQQQLHHFYLTLILYDLWQQNSVWSVSEQYDIHRGIVQNLLSSAAGFGATVIQFCKVLDEFWAYQALLPSFVMQLSYCVTTEIIPLMELPAVKRGRARQLYNAGFKDLNAIAKAEPKDLVSSVRLMPYRVATQIISAAKMMLLEKAEALQEEAELLIGIDFQNSVLFDDNELF